MIGLNHRKNKEMRIYPKIFLSVISGIIVSMPLLFTQGCATPPGVVVREADNSTADIRNTIKTLTGAPRFVSDDQREFTSEYFGKKSDKNFSPDKSKVRYFARYTVISDRRPYDIRVEVMRELKNETGYSSSELDRKLSGELAKELESRLQKNRSGKSVLDEFRPF